MSAVLLCQRTPAVAGGSVARCQMGPAAQEEYWSVMVVNSRLHALGSADPQCLVGAGCREQDILTI